MARSYRIACLLLLILPDLATNLTSVSASGSDVNPSDRFRDTTREHILETRARRKRQLKSMINDARKKLADHAAGEITLSDERKKSLQNQMDIFQRKLDTMKDELEDWVSEQQFKRMNERSLR